MRQKEHKSIDGSVRYFKKDMAALLERSGILLSPDQVEQLWNYHQYLREHNLELNLTRIHNFANMVLKLYVDSLLPGKLIDLPSPLMDVGSGPGMPGIPLKIAHPHLEIWLAESRQKRVDFLRSVTDHLNLSGIQIIGEGIGPDFEQSVAGVITRAVESIGLTLERIRGCLQRKGLAIFMKGPHCDSEVEEAVQKFSRSYRLLEDKTYSIPHTPHERRLVVFERIDEPTGAIKAQAMRRHTVKQIESERNEIFTDLKKLLSSRGVKKQKRALISGSKQVNETLVDFPDRCEAWISSGDHTPPPPAALSNLSWLQLSAPLFRVLDQFGSNSPLLVVRIPEIPAWEPSEGFPEGCSLLVPFQDPENVGTVIRSAVAFGVSRIILLAESAHPYHPKALRASGGAVLRAKFYNGPFLADLPEGLPLVALSKEGADIEQFSFPASFGLLAGIEGPGLPERWRRGAVGIPIEKDVESLNAATAAAIALFVWSRSVGGKK